MADVVLTWERFDTLRQARKRFRRLPCIYVLADKDGAILRIGESDDLWERYVGGTGWMVDAALHGSGKVIFAAEAPADLAARRRVEASLILRCQPKFCVHHKMGTALASEIRHGGDVPHGLR